MPEYYFEAAQKWLPFGLKNERKMPGTHKMTLNECFNKLLQIPDEAIKNFEKHKTEMPEGVSKPKANEFQEELERIWQPGYVSFQKSGVPDEAEFKN